MRCSVGSQRRCLRIPDESVLLLDSVTGNDSGKCVLDAVEPIDILCYWLFVVQCMLCRHPTIFGVTSGPKLGTSK